MRRNLSATYCLYEDGFHTDFSDRMSILKNDREIYQAHALNGTYVLHPKALVAPPEEEEKLSEKSIIIYPTFL